MNKVGASKDMNSEKCFKRKCKFGLSLILRGGCCEAFGGPQHAAGSLPARNPAKERKLQIIFCTIRCYRAVSVIFNAIVITQLIRRQALLLHENDRSHNITRRFFSRDFNLSYFHLLVEPPLVEDKDKLAKKGESQIGHNHLKLSLLQEELSEKCQLELGCTLDDERNGSFRKRS